MRRTAATLATTTVVLTLTAPAAVAVHFSGSRSGARVTGDVSISSSTAILSGRAYDTKADGECARLRGNWDIPLGPDQGFDVAKACGKGTSVYGIRSGAVRTQARDFEVRAYTGGSHKVVWEGDNGDA